LSNPLASPTQLSTSSSSLDEIPTELENSVRFAGALLAQAAGVLLRLPQDVIAQAIVLFTRFWVGADGGSLAVHSVKVCGIHLTMRKEEEKTHSQDWQFLQKRIC
jgi:cyclin L